MPTSNSLFVDSTKRDDMLQIYPCTSLVSSNDLGWDGIHLAYYHLPVYSIPEKISPHHLILIHSQLSSLKMNVEQKCGKDWQKIQIQDGDIIIIPANTPHRASWDREHSYICLSLDPQKLAHSTSLTDAVELLPCFKQADPLILGIGLALKAETESKNISSNLYIDSLTTTLSAHLLRHYSTQKFTLSENTDGLPKYKLCQIIEYINDNIERNFSLAELATVVNLSPSYFSYLFKLSTSYAPHQYVIRCRVERAKQLLLQKKLTIADIAYSLGFANQSHFNRHFKRLVGITPKVFQKQK